MLVAGTVAVLALTGCSSKSSSGNGTDTSGNAGGLTISKVGPVDTDGKMVTDAGAGGTPADPAGDGKATCAPTTIAFAGALTGGNAALGINIADGAKLAIDKHNKANPGCQITIKQFDTEGSPDKATSVIPQITSDASIVGLIGPAFSGETKATGKVLSDAGVPFLTASATNATLTQNGWNSFFRGLPNDDVQGPSVGKYLAATYKKVCVIQDDSDYGVGLAKSITEGLGAAADPACGASVKTGDKDFSAVVTKVAAANPDAIFYSGYYAEAAPLVSQLHSGGVKGTFVGPDGVNDPRFVQQAGSAAKGAILTCPCGPASDEFAAAYKADNGGQAPGVYSVEAYDLATILAKGIDSGKTTRADLVDFVKHYDGYGEGHHYQWGPTGELASANIWIYSVK
ncbi:branched-chain amino acid ABC transporter substrate-binding protein [Nocardia stercoris]|uniref:Branched-chain amino acid ABC transporter substrate-binding protein n=1 Tax=Nocardia stercoris TaxID=2483361 RepID=A0A3M2KY20_9NOCA|nr:branched-chain amino acid ABC transporter substrate-binding protein [Nocardia stercoris]